MRVISQILITAYAISAMYTSSFQPLEVVVTDENLRMLLIPLILSIIGIIFIVAFIFNLFSED